MIVEINVKEVLVLEREYGMDIVLIKTHNLPPTVYPYDELGDLRIDVAKGFGAAYARDNFHVEPTVIQA